MRKRLALLWSLVVLGAALALPASAAAASGFAYRIGYNYCDEADPHFRVRNIAEGYTNANRLTNETWVEKKPGQGGSWTRIYSWDTAGYRFEINGDKHWLISWRTWDGDRFNWYRIGFRIRAWHNRTLLNSTVLYSVKC